AFDIFLLRLPVFFFYLRARFPPKSMPATVKAVSPIDFAVIAAYMLLMLGIGFYAMRSNRGGSDYFKGGNRIHWLAAGLSSFMSGFSAWTFTGAAGLAYRQGLVAI